MMTSSQATSIELSPELLSTAAEKLAAKFDVDPQQINVLAWLESHLEAIAEEADYYCQFESELKPFLKR